MFNKSLLFITICLSSSLAIADPQTNVDPAAAAPQSTATAVSVTDPAVVDIANAAAVEMNKNMFNKPDFKTKTIAAITSATSQAVSGANYSLELDVVDSAGAHHTYHAETFVPAPNSDKPKPGISVWTTN